MTNLFAGSGPGIQTPDGCSVEFYRRLPYMGELSEIEPDLLRYQSALELGCGTGRLSARLLELGLAVAGVDESPEMLALLPEDVEPIQSSIEVLNLNRHWQAVLLPSHLINHPEASVRRRFVECARRHLAPDGTFYAKRHSTEWLSTVTEGLIGEASGVAYLADSVSRDGTTVKMVLRYVAYGQSWTQSFTTCALETDEIEDLLTISGFSNFKWFGKKRLWVAATASGV
jgi:SAM-dependent methyltransferase